MATQIAQIYSLMPRQGIPSARPFLARKGDSAAPKSATYCLVGLYSLQLLATSLFNATCMACATKASK